MSDTPFSISVTPLKTVAAAGQHQLSVPVTVTDTGSKPIAVSTSVAQLTGNAHGCGLAASPNWVSISGPRTFHLNPGQSISTAVRVNAPASTTGKFDFAAIYRAAVSGAHGNVNVSGAVGSRVMLNLPGKTTTAQCVIAAPVHTAASGGSSLIGGLIVAALAGLFVLAMLWLRRRVRAWRGRRPVTTAPPALSDIDPDKLAAQMHITPEQARALLRSAADPPVRSPVS